MSGGNLPLAARERAKIYKNDSESSYDSWFGDGDNHIRRLSWGWWNPRWIKNDSWHFLTQSPAYRLQLRRHTSNLQFIPAYEWLCAEVMSLAAGWIKQHRRGGLQMTRQFFDELHPLCFFILRSALENMLIRASKFSSTSISEIWPKLLQFSHQGPSPTPIHASTHRSSNCSASRLFWSMRHPSSNYCLSGVWSSSRMFLPNTFWLDVE